MKKSRTFVILVRSTLSFALLLILSGVFSSSAVAVEQNPGELAPDEVIVNSLEDESTLPDQIATDVFQLDFSDVPTEAAPADGPVPSSLKILGKGVSARRSDSSLAVACVGAMPAADADKSCNWLRGVEFTKGQTPQWIGPAFHMGNPKKFHAVLKRIYKKKYKIEIFNVKKMKQNGKRHSNWLIFSIIGAGGAWINLTPVIPAIGALSLTAALELFVGIPVGLYLIERIGLNHGTDLLADAANGITSPIRGIGHAFAHSPRGSLSMTAQNGWDWAESPKRISPKHYDRLKEVLSQFPEDTP